MHQQLIQEAMKAERFNVARSESASARLTRRVVEESFDRLSALDSISGRARSRALDMAEDFRRLPRGVMHA